MSEFVTVQVGQCGNQIGSVFWPSVLEEYGLFNNLTSHSSQTTKLDKSFKSFFNCPEDVPRTCSKILDLKRSKVTARALLIDMEEQVVDRFRHGGMRFLFDKNCFLTNVPGSGNNWAMGHYMHFNTHREMLSDMLQHTVEQCDSLAGFLILISLAGGTGAGLGTAVVRLLEDQFPLIDRLVMCVHPGICNDVVTSPYNIGHSLRILTEHASCVIPVDNKALSDICLKYNLNRGVKPFENLNKIIVNMLLNLTSGSRFSGSLNCDISDLSSLVPQPGLHYFNSSLSPLELHPPVDLSYQNKKRDHLLNVCSRDDQLTRVNALGGKLFSAALLCRGDIPLSTLRDYVTRFKNKHEFAGWGNPGIKTGLCSVPPIGHSSALLCLVNSSNMSEFFADAFKYFNLLYNRKAHVHHYTDIDGFDEDEFLLTRESLISTQTKYSEAANFIEVPRLRVS